MCYSPAVYPFVTPCGARGNSSNIRELVNCIACLSFLADQRRLEVAIAASLTSNIDQPAGGPKGALA